MSEDMRQTIGKALGRIPSGVFILTTRYKNESGAMMASWVQQAAFEPPAVSVAIAKERPIRRLIEAGRLFALSILGEENSALLKRYARGIAPNEDPFSGVKVLEAPSGMPYLADALAFLDCEVISQMDFLADHDLFAARVAAAGIMKEGNSFTHLRGNGFHY